MDAVTHTDQYLHQNVNTDQCESQHPLHQKLGAVRTMYDRCENLVSEHTDKAEEVAHIDQAFMRCGYPKWALNKCKKKNSPKAKDKRDSVGVVSIPYVKGTSEALSRCFKKHNIDVAMKPHTTIKNMLVHPKDKRELEDKSGVIYKIPCASCEQTYIGETGRNFGYRFKEHQKDVEVVTAKKVFTRSQRKTSQSEFNKKIIFGWKKRTFFPDLHSTILMKLFTDLRGKLAVFGTVDFS